MNDEAGSAANHTGRVLLIGVGDGGSAALARVLAEGLHGLDSLAVNTSEAAVARSGANWRLLLGRGITHGQGAGGNPSLGRRAAEASAAELYQALAGAQRVIILATLGGGTGSGAAPVLAYMAREQGAVVLPVVSRPFSFEGPARAQIANDAIHSLERRTGHITVVNAAQLEAWLPFNPELDKAYSLLARALAWQVLAHFTGPAKGPY